MQDKSDMNETGGGAAAVGGNDPSLNPDDTYDWLIDQVYNGATKSIAIYNTHVCR